MSVKLMIWDMTNGFGEDHILFQDKYAPSPIHIYRGGKEVPAGFYAKGPSTKNKTPESFFVAIGPGYESDFDGEEPTTDWVSSRKICHDRSLSILTFQDDKQKVPIILPSNNHDDKIIFFSLLAGVVYGNKADYFTITERHNSVYRKIQHVCNGKYFCTYVMFQLFGDVRSNSYVIVSYRDQIIKINWNGVCKI